VHEELAVLVALGVELEVDRRAGRGVGGGDGEGRESDDGERGVVGRAADDELAGEGVDLAVAERGVVGRGEAGAAGDLRCGQRAVGSESKRVRTSEMTAW
jgi:hypothetical protein